MNIPIARSSRRFKDGLLIEEIRNGIPITENLGKSANEFPDAVPSVPTVISIPRDKWPMWTKALAKFATPEDKGIGDVVARMIGEENSAQFKAWHLATFGRSCGCNGRQARLNLQYPLEHGES